MATRLNRSGVLLMELAVSFGLLAIALAIVLELVPYRLSERRLVRDRQQAQDWIHNFLEASRELPVSQLTPAWAAEQKLPPDWIDFELKVHVGDLKEPRLKQIAATVRTPLRFEVTLAAWRVLEGDP